MVPRGASLAWPCPRTLWVPALLFLLFLALSAPRSPRSHRTVEDRPDSLLPRGKNLIGPDQVSTPGHPIRNVEGGIAQGKHGCGEP